MKIKNLPVSSVLDEWEANIDGAAIVFQITMVSSVGKPTCFPVIFYEKGYGRFKISRRFEDEPTRQEIRHYFLKNIRNDIVHRFEISKI